MNVEMKTEYSHHPQKLRNFNKYEDFKYKEKCSHLHIKYVRVQDKFNESTTILILNHDQDIITLTMSLTA